MSPYPVAAVRNRMGGGGVAYRMLPQNLITTPGTLFEPFDDHTEWTLVGAGTAKADNVSQTWLDENRAVRVTTGVGTGGGIFRTINQVMTGNLRIAIYQHGELTNRDIIIRLGEDAGITVYHQAIVTPRRANAWHIFNIRTADWSAVGGANWANPKIRIRIYTTPAAGQANQFTFDALFTDVVSQAAAMFSFSDANPGAYTYAFPHTKQHHYVLDWGVTTGAVGSGGKVTWAQLQEMQASGFAHICHHTKSHTDLTTLANQVEMQTEIQTAEDDLTANGLSTYRKYFIPVGTGATYNATVRLALEAQGVLLAQVGEYVGTVRYDVLPCDRLITPVFEFLTNTLTLAAAQAEVDTAYNRGEVISFLGDNLVNAAPDPAQWNKDDWLALVNYVIGKGMPIISQADVVALASGSARVMAQK